MPQPPAPTSIRCGDCLSSTVLPEDVEPRLLLRAVRAFLDRHTECVFSMTISVPVRSAPEASRHGGG